MSTIQGLPIIRPPYGRITAIDFKTYGWQTLSTGNGGTHQWGNQVTRAVTIGC
jgi:hypothetical protein